MTMTDVWKRNTGRPGRALLLVVLSLCLVAGGGRGLPKAHAAPPQSGPRLFSAGQLALDQGKYAQALKLLRRAAKLLPHWGHVHLELARALRYNGAPLEQIARSLKKAQTLLPATNPRVALLAGLFWEGRGEADKALQAYRRTIKLGHPSAQPCLRAARIWLSRQQGRDAISCLKNLIQRGKARADAHHLLAQAYTQAQQLQDAARHWTIALSYQPNNLQVLQQVYVFYAQHTRSQRGRRRAQWRRTLRRLKRRLKRLLPRSRKRKMRMLRPSSR